MSGLSRLARVTIVGHNERIEGFCTRCENVDSCICVDACELLGQLSPMDVINSSMVIEPDVCIPDLPQDQPWYLLLFVFPRHCLCVGTP